MGGDQNDRSNGQPQSGLWFGNIDELWQMGKPSGWGGPWYKEDVPAGQASDPYLMTGFDRKVVHLTHQSPQTVKILIEVDLHGQGTWVPYQTLLVGPRGYTHHEFPEGYSAHWVRFTPQSPTQKLSVTLFYH